MPAPGKVQQPRSNMTRPAFILRRLGADNTLQTSSTNTKCPSPERSRSDQQHLFHPIRNRANWFAYRHDHDLRSVPHQTAGTNPGTTFGADINFWQGGVVQHIDAAAMDFYAIYQQTDGDACFTGNSGKNFPRRNVPRHLQNGHRWRTDPILILLPLLHLPAGPRRSHPARGGSLGFPLCFGKSER